jgi:hypothetical protein
VPRRASVSSLLTPHANPLSEPGRMDLDSAKLGIELSQGRHRDRRSVSQVPAGSRPTEHPSCINGGEVDGLGVVQEKSSCD